MNIKRIKNGISDEYLKLIKSCDGLTINNRWYRDGFRSHGYSDVQAIADIIDNSVEKSVNSKHVTVVIKYDYRTGKKTPCVYEVDIVDDGCGMTTDILTEALDMGSNTGKRRDENIGSYGVGMKDAAVAIAQRLEVLTNTDERNVISRGVIDIHYNESPNEPIINTVEEYQYDLFSPEDYSEALLHTYGHGTLVRCYDTDRIGTANPYNLSAQINEYIAMSHGAFISNGTEINIVCVGPKGDIKQHDVVSPANYRCDNVDGVKQIGEGWISGTDIMYKAWYIPSDIPEEVVNRTGAIPRSHGMSGLYVYRNGRVVGHGINFAIKMDMDKRSKKDNGYYVVRQTSQRPEYIGLRIELFATGNDDIFFKLPSTKVVGQFSTWNQTLQVSICNELGKYAEDVKRIDDEKRVERTMNCQMCVNAIINAINNSTALGMSIKNTSDFKTSKLSSAGTVDAPKSKFGKKTDNTNNKKSDETQEGTGGKNFIPVPKFLHMSDDRTFYRLTNGCQIEINVDSIVFKNVWNYCDECVRQTIIEMMVSDVVASSNIGASANDQVADILESYRKELNSTMCNLVTELPAMKKNINL